MSREGKSPLLVETASERKPMIDTYRIVTERLPRHYGWRAWRWAIEERRYNGEWEFRKDGTALTRSGALERARGSLYLAYDIDREEQVFAVRHWHTPREHKPTPMPAEMLAQEGGR